jgi:cytochrome c oxidase assembly protein subunit 15
MSATARKGADILALGLAATVAVWVVLYIAALPTLRSAPWPAAIAIAACLFGVGFLAGRSAGRGARGGAAVGMVVGAASLVVLSGMLGGIDAQARGQAALWFAGFLAATAVLPAAGASLGRRTAPDRNWTAILAWVTAATALLMLVAGGVVTGLEAGLAVEGWLVPEGHLLLLYPMSLMRRDLSTFVEHAHRLWGVLVGLSTLVLAVHVWLVEPRRWVRGLAAAILAAVLVQAALGGTRVTEQSVAIAIAHGVMAMLILAAMVVLAMGLGDAWRASRPEPRSGAATDRGLSVALLIAVLVQIALGATFRHIQPLADTPRGALMGLLHGHSFIGSTAVLVLALFCGVRSWGMYADLPPLRRSGTALVHTTILQVLLGVMSFILVPKGVRPPEDSIGGLEVLFTTAHQVFGAVLLATAASLFAWQRRLLAVKVL